MTSELETAADKLIAAWCYYCETETGETDGTAFGLNRRAELLNIIADEIRAEKDKRDDEASDWKFNADFRD